MPTQPVRTKRRWRPPPAVTAGRLLKGRFTALTIVVVIVLLSSSVIGNRDLRDLLVILGFSVLVLFAIWSVGRRLRVVTMALAVPTLLSHGALISASLVLRSLSFALVSVFLTFLTLVILLAVVRDETVTADTIVGAACAYLLLAMTWGTYYALLVLLSPDAFSVSPALINAAGWGGQSNLPITPLMQYYSFTTITTLGYGDVSPLTAGARALSVLEGVTGQLYLAVLIARLVGMYTARLRQG
jgi:hypothetical protein